MILISGCYYLGCGPGRQIHKEEFFCSEYEKSKAIADKFAIQAASHGLPIVIVYPGVIYGPGKLTAGNVVARIVR